MKAKELVSIFDTTCRQLKNHFGLETKSAKIVKLSKYPEFAAQPWVAICQSNLSLDCKISSLLLILPDRYLEQTADLDDQTLRTTAAYTACHEIAHHLDRFRMTQKWKSELLHLSPADRWRELKVRHSTLDEHGPGWQSIMQNEMLLEPHISLTPYFELSPIVGDSK